MKKTSQQILAESRALVEQIERQSSDQESTLRALGITGGLQGIDTDGLLTESQRQHAQALFDADMAEVKRNVESERVRLEHGGAIAGRTAAASSRLGRRKMI
ncbi:MULTISPECIES: hypothetical protein [Pseudomonadota]|uniref:hypothetical protein n=1 Tax=Pseudomonadota TaxID=1224 RepID=UPI0001F43D31|nr:MULTISPECIES: hypothetical protein [Pseudomonadota]EFV87781.1 hypothetical protein HMPREF0005_03195 [Achromobacter xylosoxidans C54]MBP8322307.1 hypothetical protein [Pseudomonas aeruginosa]MCZ8441441.1 hypothetical protein [Achromobacter xylosoxidans]MDC6165079.1 hypothetical protein [Achromobacter xylosoxidans]CUJ27013.1 Uncharacterised protein [Achromobacter xylosoxidans]